ncbi:hypothetical protein FHT02_000573 [Sphingomonas xinjiangensis]|uniref:Uncharacterized protein n=1 Tax=Sphingomonas xinjiangensis TaxID=643568 RepID=A0A840Y7U3_9SPHN|nr:hypothetical protein [Sphingomonas xinjiangensis]
MTPPTPYGTAISERSEAGVCLTGCGDAGSAPPARAHLSNLFSGEKA